MDEIGMEKRTSFEVDWTENDRLYIERLDCRQPLLGLMNQLTGIKLI